MLTNGKSDFWQINFIQFRNNNSNNFKKLNQ